MTKLHFNISAVNKLAKISCFPFDLLAYILCVHEKHFSPSFWRDIYSAVTAGVIPVF